MKHFRNLIALLLIASFSFTPAYAIIPTSIGDLSTSAAGNDPQGTDVIGTSLDDYLRAMQAIIRQESVDKEWLLPEYSVSYASSTSFTISGEDVTATYSVGRRVKAIGSGTGTIYGKISTSVWDTVDTTVTIVWDSGSLTNEDLIVYLASIQGSATGALSGNARSIDFDNATLHGSDIASASTVNLSSATGNIVDITGTTAITAITLEEGRMRVVRFTGILTLTNGASLVLPNSTNITTAAGDFAIFVGYSGGVVRCVSYSRVPQATETLSGTAEIATQAETDGGSNDTNFITPLKLASTTAISGGFKSIQVFTSSGTWTKPSGISKIFVEVVGGGAGASGSSTAGSNGGTSSFGSLCSATGGFSASIGSTLGGAGGVGSLGTINISGNPGSAGTTVGGNGGSSSIGGGGLGGDGAAGSNGESYGGGGGGGDVGPGLGGGGGGGTSKIFITSPSSSEIITVGAGGNGGGVGSSTGGNGSPGIVIIYEYS